MAVNAPLLQLENCTVKFGGLTAVCELNLELRERELVGLIGPNGAGKTTVFNVVTGVYAPTSGAVRFAGEDI
jgi:branched-chain amino acid transport system ATP-binding protein